MSEKLESSIQTEIIHKLKKDYKDIIVYKHPPVPAGIPDIHVVYKGKSIWFEVKRSSKHKATELQLLRHRQLRKAGAVVKIVWNYKQVKKVIDEEK